ncbi:MAG: PspC domain-containing protein [Flavobacteriales bacterium]|nr:PspC domain-containing protein [Flavobacteriales bacterium]
MNRFTLQIFDYFERRAFGVCSSIGRHMHVRANRIRLWFIYLSFLTFGSPIFFYLVLLFWKQNRHIFQFKRGRRTVWE